MSAQEGRTFERAYAQVNLQCSVVLLPTLPMARNMPETD